MKQKTLVLLFGFIFLVLFLGIISPTSAQLPVYLVLFSIVYTIFAALFSIIIDVAYAKTPKNRRRFTAIVLAFSPTILLALASLSSISVVDFILAVSVPAAIVWYGLHGTVVK